MGRREATSEDDLVLPLDFEVDRSERTMRRAAAALTLFVFAAIAVMAVAPVREVAVASGEIMPSTAIAEVRHVDGGEVGFLNAVRGEAVRRGDALVTLRPLRVESELRQLTTRRAHLALKRERLAALIEGREPVFFDDVELSLGAADSERILWASEKKAFDSQLDSLEARRRQRTREAEAKRTEVAGLELEISAYARQLTMRETLLERGAASLNQVLEATAQTAEARARLAAATGAAAAAEAAAAEAESEAARLEAEKRNDWSRELLDASGQIAELDRTIARLRDQLDRTVIRAPIDGRVLELGDLTIGGVIAPGGLAARIVPHDAEMVAEVRVAPEDVGHIAVGSEADVSVTTFDKETFGAWRGVITALSPASFEAEDGSRHFRAELALSHEPPSGQSGGGGGRPLLSPGMTVQADIRTGERSILRYLLKPIFRVADRTFGER